MNMHVMGEGEIALTADLPGAVAEYEAKIAAIPEAIAAFEAAGEALKAAACVRGEWGSERIDTGHIHKQTMETSLRRSAWVHFWKSLNLPSIASAKDKKRFDQAMANPPPFDLDTLVATFAPYLENPRKTILRGLAEVFADLDPAYKSHEKVKIGAKGLPKRVIISSLGARYSYGVDQLRNVLSALAAYQGKPLPTQDEIDLLFKNGEALRDGGTFPSPYNSRYESKAITVIGRGVWLKRFQNGNGHLFFGPAALADINRALAEFYGDVLADSPEAWAERPAKRPGTEVARDLQFYPTPRAVIDRILSGICALSEASVLEPSCGDGRIMDVLVAKGALVTGCEVDPVRAAICQRKGHSVMLMNFLDTVPTAAFDYVVMNPPFYGRHYAKHVRHALGFLKPGGHLYAILPATARYDHGLLDDLSPSWEDLPVGAFAESGANICTTVCTVRRRA